VQVPTQRKTTQFTMRMDPEVKEAAEQAAAPGPAVARVVN
jgi:predicted HicB family RNase H-like nuclease